MIFLETDRLILRDYTELQQDAWQKIKGLKELCRRMDL